MMSSVFQILLWHFRIFGLLPNSKTKWIDILSKIFSGLNLLVNGILLFLVVYWSEKYVQHFSGEVYVYVGFGLYYMSIVTCVVNLIEIFMNSDQHLQVFNDLFTITNEPSKQFNDKFFKLKCKGVVLVPSLTIMFGIWLSGLFKIFGLDAITLVYFNCFMFLRSVQFFIVVDGIRIKLEIVNEDLVELLEIETKKPIRDLKLVRVKVEKIRADYLYLKDMSIILNDCSAWSIFCLAFLFTCFMICISYWFLLSLVKDIIMLEPYQSLCYIIVTFLTLAITTHPCSQCLSLSSQLGYNIHKLQQLGEDPATVEQLAAQITNNPIIFTAAGYFQVNYGLLASILGATVTYLMILINFTNDEGQKLFKHRNGTLVNETFS